VRRRGAVSLRTLAAPAATVVLMPHAIEDYYCEGSVGAVIARLRRETALEGPNGRAAVVAIDMLLAERIEQTVADLQATVKRMDQNAGKWQHRTLIVGAVVAIVAALLGAIVTKALGG
jgi:hypothetical protein